MENHVMAGPSDGAGFGGIASQTELGFLVVKISRCGS